MSEEVPPPCQDQLGLSKTATDPEETAPEQARSGETLDATAAASRQTQTGNASTESPDDASGQTTEETAETVKDYESAVEETVAPTNVSPAVFPGIDDLKNHLERLERSFDEKIKYDAHREAIIDRLHAELQEHKADLAFKILKPFALDLISMHDDMGKQIAALQKRSDESGQTAKLTKVYEDFQSDLEDVLYRSGFECFETEEDDFDPKRQRVMERVPTSDERLNRKIARRVRKGFRWEDRVVRPEMVDVNVHEPDCENQG